MNTLKAQIDSWCLSNSVTIPSGFFRHPANRYVAIDTRHTPHRLVARTWFNLEDLDHYLSTAGTSASYRALDFKERRELVRTASGRLARADEF